VNSQSKKGNSVEDAVSLEVKRTSESSYFRETEFLCRKTAFLQIYGIKNELFGSVANYFGETQVLCRKKRFFCKYSIKNAFLVIFYTNMRFFSIAKRQS